MNATKWTAGPWHLNRAIKDKLYVEAEGPVLICDMQLEACVASTRAITEADANLIAAAPELYAALHEAVGVIRLGLMASRDEQDDEGVLAQAEAALAKARGEEVPMHGAGTTKPR